MIAYDATGTNKLGFNSSKIVLRTDEDTLAKKDFYVIATVSEYFPEMSEEELAKAPKLAFNKNLHDFGKIEKDGNVEVDFILTNTGKNTLNIRDTQTNCQCTRVELESNDILPGESTTMKVRFIAYGRRGRQYKQVTIFSNDPTAPTQAISIKAEISKS